MRHYLIRLGLFGQVGRFRALGAERYARGMRVVCRTARGLEVGEVLCEAGEPSANRPAANAPAAGESEPNGHQANGRDAAESAFPQPDGALLRRMTAEDELLAVRLEKHKREAQAACVALLAERGLSAVLLDVEPLLDGRSLFFYFLGEVSPEVEAVTQQLAAAYEAQAGLRKFAETMLEGCGPGCGTAEGAGCGADNGEASGGCAGCSIAGACGTQP